MEIKADEITKIIREQIEDYRGAVDVATTPIACDMNHDGHPDGLDVQAFVDAIITLEELITAAGIRRLNGEQLMKILIAELALEGATASSGSDKKATTALSASWSPHSLRASRRKPSTAARKTFLLARWKTTVTSEPSRT